MLNIRPYKLEDFDIVSSWHEYHGITLPADLLVDNGTFILELNNVPTLCITVLLTQSKKMAYLFGYIKNPLFNNINLEEYGKLLWNHCFKWTKEQGYSQLICFSDNDKLTEKYKRFGMTENLKHLTSFIKEV